MFREKVYISLFKTFPIYITQWLDAINARPDTHLDLLRNSPYKLYTYISVQIIKKLFSEYVNMNSTFWNETFSFIKKGWVLLILERFSFGLKKVFQKNVEHHICSMCPIGAWHLHILQTIFRLVPLKKNWPFYCTRK